MSSGTHDHKMEDHNMGVAKKKLQKQQQQQYKQTKKQTKRNSKGMSYDSTNHSAQFHSRDTIPFYINLAPPALHQTISLVKLWEGDISKQGGVYEIYYPLKTA